ncbi:MAG: hypothetical protein K8R57_02420 [Verrucomicrobia bacterium]|nr:hypothetical protein [Verrucomicrobiota bacterium]
MKRPPLLITASLDAGITPYVALSATSDRTEAHMQGLLAWLGDPSTEKVVFAKNCSARIRSEVLVATARNYGKELEFVQVDSSKRTVIQGKGYGEGDLIRQALEKSDLLKGADDFIKVTGKLFCPGTGGIFSGEGEGEFFVSRHVPKEDFMAIRRMLSPLYKSQRGSRALGFLKRRMRIPWGLVASAPGALVDTRLYRVNKAFYLSSLGQSYRRVQDGLGYTLERAFHDDLMGRSSSVRMLEISPAIIGTSGSMGTTAGEISEAIRMEARELALRLAP